MFEPTRVAKEWRDIYTTDALKQPDWTKLKYFVIMDKVLDKWFQKCDRIPCQNFDITPPAGTLQAFSKITKLYTDQNTAYKNAWIIAEGIMKYWSKAIKPAEPCKLSKVTQVINDALIHIEPLANDIIKIRSKKEHNGYLDLATIIYKHIKSITWEIIEEDSVSKTTIIGQVI